MTLKNEIREIYDAAMCIPEPFTSLTDDEKRVAKYLLDRLGELEAEHGELPLNELLRPMLLSKNGKHSEALSLSEEHYQREPSWTNAVALANAARRAGNIDYALHMFAQAAHHDPTDVSSWLEIGDIHLERSEFSDALKAYETALSKQAFNQWALPSVFYCRHHLGVEGNWLASLQEFANQEGCTCGLQDCLTELLGIYGSADGIARAEYLLAKLESPTE